VFRIETSELLDVEGQYSEGTAGGQPPYQAWFLYRTDMNLQQLRYLVAATDSGSVSAAARQLGVSQPVMSRALHGLEREYDLTLFQQTGRCLTLTDAGQSVVQEARRALQACDEVERTARRIALGTELDVVTTPTNSALLSPIVTSFVHRRPRTAIHLERAGSIDEVLRVVRAGDAELGFGDLSEQLDDASLMAHGIWSAEVVLVSPVGTQLPPAVRLDELGTSRLVLPSKGTKRRRAIERVIASASGSVPLAALATDERSAWVTSAQQGIGSFLSYRAVASEFDGVEIRQLDPAKHVDVGFFYRPEFLAEDARQMLELAEQCPLPVGCRRLAEA
jgi:DNA-binding transcriptional LysR family regulator